jgi:hypothetical protein
MTWSILWWETRRGIYQGAARRSHFSNRLLKPAEGVTGRKARRVIIAIRGLNKHHWSGVDCANGIKSKMDACLIGLVASVLLLAPVNTLAPVDTTTLHQKTLVGYQGRIRAAGDRDSNSNLPLIPSMLWFYKTSTGVRLTTKRASMPIPPTKSAQSPGSGTSLTPGLNSRE